MEALMALALMLQAGLSVAFFLIRNADKLEFKLSLHELSKSRIQLAAAKNKIDEKTALIEELQMKVNALSVSAGIRR